MNRSFDIYSYVNPVRNVLYINNKRIRTREGLIIYLYEGNKTGRGEIAPLPGMNNESLDDAKNQIIGCLNKWRHKQAPCNFSLFPSVAFGLSCATAELQQQLPIMSSFSVIPNCYGDPDEILRYLYRHPEVYTIHLTVGIYESIRDAMMIKLLLQAFPYLKIRLTGCQSWNIHKAEQFIQVLTPKFHSQIEYICSPCLTPQLSAQFTEKHQLPLALELTTNNQANFNWLLPSLMTIILKPTQIGSLQHCRALIDKALNYHLVPIIADNFESTFGLSQLNAFAHQQLNYKIPQITCLNFTTQQIIHPFSCCTSLPLLTKHQLIPLLLSDKN